MPIIALHTYGLEKQQGRSCVKCTHHIPAILLTLFGAHAADLTPARASYHYIQVHGAHLTHNFLVLKVTDGEKALIESYTRSQQSSPQAFLWEDENWYEFPYGGGSGYGHSDFRLACATSTTSYPRFSGQSVSTLTPSLSASSPSTTASTASGTIHIERSTGKGHGHAWWWISGETRPVKDILKSAGARWSHKRQAWYYIGDSLPTAISSLAHETIAPDAAVLDRLFEAAVKDDPVELAQNTSEPRRRLTLPPFGRDRGTDLMPSWLFEAIPFNGQVKDDQGRPLVWAKLFMPDANWYLFVSDIDRPRGRLMCYAILNYDLEMAEWGWQYLEDLTAVRGPLRLPMERDLSFQVQSLDEALTEFKRERGLEDTGTRPTAGRVGQVTDRINSGSDGGEISVEISLPAAPAIAAPPEGPTYQTMPLRSANSAVTPFFSEEAVMRSVQTDDVQAALIAYIHDAERGKPILIDFIGSRNAVKQLLARPFNPGNIGRGEGIGFTLVTEHGMTPFKLPDDGYKGLSAGLKNRAVEGRIVALDATTAAPKKECYVLVSGQILIPHVDLHEPVLDLWLRYVRYTQAPNRPEFAGYEAPAWARDLFTLYQALRVRIGRPLHVRWMPWLFEQVADKVVSSAKLGLTHVVLCKYIHGYVDPRAKGAVEGGAYRLLGIDVGDLWGEILMQNPDRLDGIIFDPSA